MIFDAIPSFLAILLCAALFVLLFQYLFPRPAPWGLAAAALISGVLFTLLLIVIMTHFLRGGQEELMNVSSLAEALPVAVFRAGLPEETIKMLAALAVIMLFRRNLTAAAAFQIPLFVAVGFAIVENNGYSDAFPEYRMIIAVGRGFMATFVHSLLAMVQGVFLMRMIAQDQTPPDPASDPGTLIQRPSGAVVWNRWYFVVLGLLAAAACHSLYDWGFLPVLAEFLKTGNVRPETAAVPLLVGVGGIILLFVAGLWSLRIATRRAAALDPIVDEPSHRASVSTWRKTGTALILLGGIAFVGALAWLIFAGQSLAVAVDDPSLTPALFAGCGLLGALFASILGWVVRQKR